MLIPMVDMKHTGENIVSLRRRKGLTVRDIQRLLGFTTPQAIYKWQRGEAMPTLDNMIVLAAVFNVTVDEILVLQERFRIRVIA